MSRHKVTLVPEPEGGCVVIVPSFPGCVTCGDTRKEAMAKEAIELYLESCQAHGDPIPQESGIEHLVVEVKEPVA